MEITPDEPISTLLNKLCDLRLGKQSHETDFSMTETLAYTLIGLLILVTAGLVALKMRGVPPSPAEDLEVPTPAEPVHVSHPHPEDILEQMSEGVVVLDSELRPTFLNLAARTMLGLQATGLPERLTSQDVDLLAQRVKTDKAQIEEVVALWYPTRSSIKVRVAPLPTGGILVLLQDVTDEALAQRVRREFVSHASHELKSPVAGLQTLAEAVSRALEDDPVSAARFAERMTSEAARLGRLVSDLLDLSRLEDADRVPDEKIDLSDVARRELGLMEPSAAAKGMSLVDRIAAGVWVQGDDEQLGLMVRNLLENAIRYTPDGGTVSVEVTNGDVTALVRVHDTGIGIPREAQGRVFERFYRVDRARSRDRGGTGLGLAIVKHVAELHGGQVLVESELGEGSIFTVSLPSLDSPHMPARRAG